MLLNSFSSFRDAANIFSLPWGMAIKLSTWGYILVLYGIYQCKLLIYANEEIFWELSLFTRVLGKCWGWSVMDFLLAWPPTRLSLSHTFCWTPIVRQGIETYPLCIRGNVKCCVNFYRLPSTGFWMLAKMQSPIDGRCLCKNVV